MANVYIQMLGSSDECLKYKVKLSIRDKEGLEVVSHYDHPYSVYMEEEDKIDGGLLITTKRLKKACKPPVNQRGAFSFTVCVKFDER